MWYIEWNRENYDSKDENEKRWASLGASTSYYQANYSVTSAYWRFVHPKYKPKDGEEAVAINFFRTIGVYLSIAFCIFAIKLRKNRIKICDETGKLNNDVIDII